MFVVCAGAEIGSLLCLRPSVAEERPGGAKRSGFLYSCFKVPDLFFCGWSIGT